MSAKSALATVPKATAAATDRLPLEAIDSALTTARDRMREDVAPAITAAVEQALDATEPARSEALNRASNALSALKGEAVATPAAASRWPVAFVGIAVGVALGFAVAQMRARKTPPPSYKEQP